VEHNGHAWSAELSDAGQEDLVEFLKTF